jgi:antitoxin component YwqK of YwqJK toxin-antitoxin module
VAEGWYPTGVKSWVAQWNGRKPMGTHQNWHPNGKLQRKQVFADGALSLYTEWHVNGQMTLEAKYRGTALVSQKRWDAKGVVLLDEGATAGLPPTRKPDPPKPNPFSAGRRTVWVTGQLNRVYKDKDAEVVQTAFGTPDEMQGNVWVYKNLGIIDTTTRRRLTIAHFYISNGKVILVEEK